LGNNYLKYNFSKSNMVRVNKSTFLIVFTVLGLYLD